jgi:hypothetical protein
MHAALLQTEIKNRVIELANSPTKKDALTRVYALFERTFNYEVFYPLIATATSLFVFVLLYFLFTLTDTGYFYIDQAILWATGIDVSDQTISSEVRIHAGVLLMFKTTIAVILTTFITAKLHYNKKKRVAMNECGELLNTLENREALKLIADNDTMYPGEMAKSLLER